MKEIKYIPVSEIIPYENNPRKNEEAAKMAAESIKQFGFNVPILLDRNNVIIAGHTRYKAAIDLGLEKAPCIILDLDEKLTRQYRIIDNKTSDLSSWDYEKLTYEMDSVPEIDFSVFGLNNEEDDEEGVEITGSLDEGVELDLEDYEDDQFEFECPYCGFKWNE